MAVSMNIVTNFDIFEHLAHLGFEAGRKKTGELFGVAEAGAAWEDMPRRDRECWIAATKAIVTGSILSPGITPEDSGDARLAYAAYGSVTEFKNYQGNPMPEWRDLPEKIRQAWCAAANAVANSRLKP